jgi:hypothetical protein
MRLRVDPQKPSDIADLFGLCLPPRQTSLKEGTFGRPLRPVFFYAVSTL